MTRSPTKQVSELRSFADFFFGHGNDHAMAKALETPVEALRVWYQHGDPANIGLRIRKLCAALAMKHVSIALRAAEWSIKVNGRSDRKAVAVASRLRAIKRDLLRPKPKPAAKVPANPVPQAAAPQPDIEPAIYIVEGDHDYDPNRTLDDLCKGQPEWWQAAVRELEERPD